MRLTPKTTPPPAAPEKGIPHGTVNLRGTNFSSRVVLVHINTVRAIRGCDAESVVKSICDATHPKLLRWVFNLAINADGRTRDLRFWKEEVLGNSDKKATPESAIDAILGHRNNFPRGEVEIMWTINAATILRLVRSGQITESGQRLTRQSLAEFLKRRLQ